MRSRVYRCVLFLVVIAVGLSACAPSEEAISEAISATMESWTPIPSYTPQASQTSAPTIAVEVTRLFVVTTTYTPTPRFTATITLTPTNTSTPTKTPTITKTPNATQTAQASALERLRRDKGNGFYLVNVDIAPGVWRSKGSRDGCYWATTSASGSILNNHYGMSGGTAYISPSAFQVEFSDCGIWTFLSPP